jgi:amidohydrolase
LENNQVSSKNLDHYFKLLEESYTYFENDLIELSHLIHSNPELAFNEFKAVKNCLATLLKHGLKGECDVYDLPTAIELKIGKGITKVAICAEYDALPEIGHACGHNIIAAAAVGAVLLLKDLTDELNLSVTFLGTPGEEGGGGKILMMERGAFDNIDAAMMIHPAPIDSWEMKCRAIDQYSVSFRGKASHASSAPELGKNALDAQVLSQVAIGLLRQQLNQGDQIHGIITHGGDAANVIPEFTSSMYYLRAPTVEKLELLKPKVFDCFTGAAIATQTEVEITSTAPVYSEFKTDGGLLSHFKKAASFIGLNKADINDVGLSASTDMANISLKVPSIHPLIGIDSHGSVNHQNEFAAACVGQSANAAIKKGAVSMALTAISRAMETSK